MVFDSMDNRGHEQMVFCDDRYNVTTHKAASKVAEKRMQEVVKLKNIYLPKKNVMGRRDSV